jgi:hypothetical protein
MNHPLLNPPEQTAKEDKSHRNIHRNGLLCTSLVQLRQVLALLLLLFPHVQFPVNTMMMINIELVK